MSWIAGASPSWRRPASRGRPSNAGSTRSDPAEAFMSRMFLKQILLVLADDQASPRERLEARRELYRRLIAARIVD